MVQVLRFDNGSFVSITEGQEKIGGMLASIATEPVPSTTTIIPPKSESIFLDSCVTISIAITHED